MATANIPDVKATGEWQNLLADHPDLAGKDCLLQNKVPGELYIVAEGASPSSKTAGVMPTRMGEHYFNCTTALWYRADVFGDGFFAVWTVG
ncbi:MAG TPA: hypothetical protein VF463_10475 [Sphingobium sp.]